MGLKQRIIVAFRRQHCSSDNPRDRNDPSIQQTFFHRSPYRIIPGAFQDAPRHKQHHTAVTCNQTMTILSCGDYQAVGNQVSPWIICRSLRVSISSNLPPLSDAMRQPYYKWLLCWGVFVCCTKEPFSRWRTRQAKGRIIEQWILAFLVENVSWKHISTALQESNFQSIITKIELLNSDDQFSNIIMPQFSFSNHVLEWIVVMWKQVEKWDKSLMGKA